MSNIFVTIFYQPILNLLILLYNIVPYHDFGLAIILMTVVIRLVFWPLGSKAIKSQKALQDLQPKIEEIKVKYADDKVGSSQAMMQLYKDNKVNPFSSCLPLLVQLPFLFAVYRVFQAGISNNLSLAYSFIHKPEIINTLSFGFIDLAKPNVYLAVLAGAAQFWQAKMMNTKRPAVKSEGAKDEDMMAIMNKQMLYIMPAMTIIIGISLPGGLTLYWFVLTILTAAQQWWVFKHHTNKTGMIEGEIIK